MVERYCFAVRDFDFAIERSLALRQYGFRTFLRVERIAITDLIVVHALPPKRATRKERGCAAI